MGGDGMRFDEVVALAQELVRIPSPNPEGDTTQIASYVRSYLERAGIESDWIEPHPGRVNIVSTLVGRDPGPHIVLNAHLDVFPVETEEGWSDDPLSGVIRDGRLWGRGANDMKAGAAVFIELFRSIAEQGSALRGRLTLMLVCDEESFGDHGSRWLLANHADLTGDVLLSTEPGGLGLVRTAERGMVWAEVKFTGKGGHGAHPVREVNALARARRFMDAVDGTVAAEGVDAESFLIPHHQQERYDQNMGEGAYDHVRAVTANFGEVTAGVKINMQPAAATVKVDVRVPPGFSSEERLQRLRDIAADLGGEVSVLNFIEPNVTGSELKCVSIFRDIVENRVGQAAVTGPSPGCSDARLWRELGVPAISYGPYPHGMGGVDEYCELSELEVVAGVHQEFVTALLLTGGNA
jgi:succinyl-diaminopimelate desuccinylase